MILLLLLGLFGIGYAIFNIAIKPPGGHVVRVQGVGNAQEIFGGVPQEGERVGSSDAPVSIQYFADLQCSSCRENFLATIPTLITDYARNGEVQMLMRHYSVAENPLELGFFGAEAAAVQGYGWQYTYLFFRNQEEAARLEVDRDFMESLAGSIGELEVLEWKQDLEREEATDGPVKKRLESYEQLGAQLGIRTKPAAVINGPGGTRTLQDGPSLVEFERAIAEVR